MSDTWFPRPRGRAPYDNGVPRPWNHSTGTWDWHSVVETEPQVLDLWSLKKDDLKEKCREMGLAVGGNNEALIARIREATGEDLDELKKDDLKERCRKKGLAVGGNNEALIERLKEAMEKAPMSRRAASPPKTATEPRRIQEPQVRPTSRPAKSPERTATVEPPARRRQEKEIWMDGETDAQPVHQRNWQKILKAGKPLHIEAARPSHKADAFEICFDAKGGLPSARAIEVPARAKEINLPAWRILPSSQMPQPLDVTVMVSASVAARMRCAALVVFTSTLALSHVGYVLDPTRNPQAGGPIVGTQLRRWSDIGAHALNFADALMASDNRANRSRLLLHGANLCSHGIAITSTTLYYLTGLQPAYYTDALALLVSWLIVARSAPVYASATGVALYAVLRSCDALW